MSNYQIITDPESKTKEGIDMVKTSLRVNGKIFWSIKQLALDQRRNVTELADEAFRDLLEKYGMKIR